MMVILDNSLYENELTFQRCSEDTQQMKSATDVEDDCTLNKKSEISKKAKQNNKGNYYFIFFILFMFSNSFINQS